MKLIEIHFNSHVFTDVSGSLIQRFKSYRPVEVRKTIFTSFMLLNNEKTVVILSYLGE